MLLLWQTEQEALGVNQRIRFFCCSAYDLDITIKEVLFFLNFLLVLLDVPDLLVYDLLTPKCSQGLQVVTIIKLRCKDCESQRTCKGPHLSCCVVDDFSIGPLL